MTVTVQLPSELVEAVRALARQTGQDLDDTIAGLLQEQLQTQTVPPPPSPSSAPTESDLLQQIQQGLPEVTWDRYHELQTRREAEQLTPKEQRELIALTDAIEGWNVRRLQWAKIHRHRSPRSLYWRDGTTFQSPAASLGRSLRLERR